MCSSAGEPARPSPRAGAGCARRAGLARAAPRSARRIGRDAASPRLATSAPSASRRRSGRGTVSSTQKHHGHGRTRPETGARGRRCDHRWMAACPVCPSCSRPLTADRCAACGAAARAGPYQILSVLAQSPHGRTYRARGPGGLVALKELVFALVPTAQQLDAFEREAKLLASVSHPQIPRFVDSFREGEGPNLRLYLAQELIEAQPLSPRI